MIDFHIVIGGLIIGLLVGLTGVGGSALMLPVLVLLFRIPPLIAVGTDLAYSVPTKIVGALVHRRQGTINPRLVFQLAAGGVPAAVVGVLSLAAIKAHISLDALNALIKHIVAGLLIVVAIAIVAVQFVPRKPRAEEAAGTPKAALVVLVGVIVGFAVSTTSIGAGSIGLTLLALIAPRLRLQQLVGTDIAFAAIIVPVATVGHFTLGSVSLPVTLSLLVGSIPGVYAGSRLCGILPVKYLRPVMAGVMAFAATRLF